VGETDFKRYLVFGHSEHDESLVYSYVMAESPDSAEDLFVAEYVENSDVPDMDPDEVYVDIVILAPEGVSVEALY
jgi:hypothetical protein